MQTFAMLPKKEVPLGASDVPRAPTGSKSGSCGNWCCSDVHSTLPYSIKRSRNIESLLVNLRQSLLDLCEN